MLLVFLSIKEALLTHVFVLSLNKLTCDFFFGSTSMCCGMFRMHRTYVMLLDAEQRPAKRPKYDTELQGEFQSSCKEVCLLSGTSMF